MLMLATLVFLLTLVGVGVVDASFGDVAVTDTGYVCCGTAGAGYVCLVCGIDASFEVIGVVEACGCWWC